MCAISIVMPVYNGEKHLRAALESILNQSFTNFELIVIDDDSEDSTSAIIQSYSDRRILYIRIPQHKGVAYALNYGLAYAKGDLILRADADDINTPERLQIQVDFMEKNPSVSICGSDTELIDDTDNITGYRDTKKGDQCIKIALFMGETSLAHPAVAIRRTFLAKHSFQYSMAYPYAEDYELWCRSSICGKFENLPTALVQYRHHPLSVSQAHARLQRLSARRILTWYLHQLGMYPSQEDLECHLHFSLALDTQPAKKRMTAWRDKLITWNLREHVFAPDIFESELEQRYQRIIR